MRFLKTTADKLSAFQLFVVFNAVFLLAGAGMLALMRSFYDLYAPMPVSALTILPLGLGWIVVFLAFVFFFLCLRHQKQLENLGASLFFFSFLELVLLGFLTFKAYTSPLRNHVEEEREKTIEMMVQANENPASLSNGNFAFVNMTLKLRMLRLQYKAVRVVTEANIESMRPVFQKDACEYLSTYSHYDSLIRVVFDFMITSKDHVTLGFSPKDCLDVPGAEKSTSLPAPQISPAAPPVLKAESRPQPVPPQQNGTSAPPLDQPAGQSSKYMDTLQGAIDGFGDSLRLFDEEVKRLKKKLSPPVEPAASPEKAQ